MVKDLDMAIEYLTVYANTHPDPEARGDFAQVAEWLTELKRRRATTPRITSEWLPTGSDPRKGRCKNCRGRSFRSFKFCPDCGALMIKGRA